MAKKKSAIASQQIQPPVTNAAPELIDLFLNDASVSRHNLKVGEPPQYVPVTAGFAFAELPDKPGHVFFQVKLNLEASYNPGEESAVKIQATFVIVYKFPSEDKLPQEVLKAWGEQNAVMHTWPYWREFVQSATTRMGLPALRMPLLVRGGLVFQKTNP